MHDLVLDEPLRVDDEESSDGHTLPLIVDAVAPGSDPVSVARERETQSAKAAPRLRRRDPALVRLDRVATDPHEIAIVRRELVEPLAEPDQLGRADQREVARV